MAHPKARRPQKGNPSQLTIRQHVLPRRSIARFAGEDKKVELLRLGHEGVLRLTSDNPIFCATRAWDQRAESGYSRDIEVGYQSLADSILAGRTELAESDHLTISRFWALWSLRAEARAKPAPPLQLAGVLEAREFTPAEQEALESKHVVFVENGSQVPSHMWVGLKIQLQIDRIASPQIHWGIIHSPDAEFIVPARVGAQGFVPLSPNFALLANHASGTITKDETSCLNKLLLSSAGDYVFARVLHYAIGESATSQETPRK